MGSRRGRCLSRSLRVVRCRSGAGRCTSSRFPTRFTDASSKYKSKATERQIAVSLEIRMIQFICKLTCELSVEVLPCPSACAHWFSH